MTDLVADHLNLGLVDEAALAATVAAEVAANLAAAMAGHEAASNPHGTYLTAAEGNAAYQPVDSDLTSIAALTTTPFGRGLLALADGSTLAANHSHGGSLDFGEVGDIVASAFGDTAAAGATGEIADAGHRHAREVNPVTAHEAAGNPHPTYVHPDLAAHDTLGLVTDAILATHAGAADPHPGYLTPAEGNAAYATTGHTHAGSGPTVAKLTTEQVSAVTAFANITNMTRAIAAGECVYFKAFLGYRANAITTGIKLGVNGPASPTKLFYRTSTTRTNALQSAAGATDNEGTFNANTYDAPAADSGVAAVNVDYIATIEGVIFNGANAGTLAMRFASEVAVANGITLARGSHVMFWTI